MVLIAVTAAVSYGCGETPNTEGEASPQAVSPAIGALEFTHGTNAAKSAAELAASECLVADEDTVLASDVDCILVDADGITIDLNRFTVHGPILGMSGWNDIQVTNGAVSNGAIILGARTVLSRLTVRDSDDFVVQLGFDSVISRSLFERNDVAVDLFWGNGIEVRECRFVENSIAINIASDNDSRVIGNRFEGNGVGVRVFDEDFVGSSGSRIVRNLFRDNDLGVYVLAQDEANDTEISWNLFRSNSSSGITVILGCSTDFSPLCGGRDTMIEKNLLLRNGDDPRTLTGGLPLPDDWQEYEVTPDDGLTVFAVDGAADGVTATRNVAIRNADLGIDADGIVDGGANRAAKNGNPLECVGVSCR
jgi:hypothetical protein